MKVRLKIPAATTAHDDKIQEFIDAAEAEYARYVGPLSGTVTESLDGGSTSVILASANVSAVTEAAYSDGTAVSVDDLELDTRTGIVHWGYGTAGRFAYGSRNVVLTYTIGTLTADHREAIIADVAGYFAATQRAGDERTDANGYADGFYNTPMNLFPRIRALAAPVVA